MSTIADVVNRTKQKLSGFSTRDRVNVLNATIVTGKQIGRAHV